MNDLPILKKAKEKAANGAEWFTDDITAMFLIFSAVILYWQGYTIAEWHMYGFYASLVYIFGRAGYTKYKGLKSIVSG